MYAMKKILLPRKDHEVYFIPPPEGIKRRRTSVYIEDALHERHPGFSSSCVYDVRKVSVNGRPWIMTTVMERETLAEYRVIHPHALLFTATGVLIHRPGFTRTAMTVLADETIGYDAVNNMPVSIPVTETRETAADISRLLRKTLPRYRVFKTRRSPLLYALLLPALASGGILLARHQGPPPEKPPPAIPVPKPDMPGPLALLAELAGVIRQAGGTVDLWHYDETTGPEIAVQITGAEAGAIYTLISGIPYVLLHDISDISYTGGKPLYTARLSRNGAAYRVPEPGSFASQEEALRLFSLLRERLSPLRVAVVSESPPAAGAGTGAVSLQAEGRDLANALEAVAQTFTEYGLGIRAMSVSLDRPSGVFTFSCSLAPYQDTPAPVMDANDIPAVFGYAEHRAPEPPAAPLRQEEPPVIHVGIIKDEGRTTTTYYKNPEGKIIIREEQRP
jgi:hypothetical protein